MRWAIVIGIDEYGSDKLRLSGAVGDACKFDEWVRSREGGNVPRSNVRLLLGRRADDSDGNVGDGAPTKDNVVKAINDAVTAAEAAGQAERLYFFFSGHGITADLAGREESALVMPGFDFDPPHTDHSLAVRSIAEHLETTPFQDQFFFVDACRDAPKERLVKIGRWPIPRRRDPGTPPVQQFILYATSPGLTAAETDPFDEAVGAFTEVLLGGLKGKGRAKAWSWERNCYEVRWEGLATYVNKVMTDRKYPTRRPAGSAAERWPTQIPQDGGSRGVAGRDRDAVLASYERGGFGALELTVELKGQRPFREAEVTVVDSIGEPVVSSLKVPPTPVTFTLPPRTYAARAIATDEQGKRAGRVAAPIELYDDDGTSAVVELREDTPREGQTGRETPGTIEILAHDPLATAEIRDEAGRVADVLRAEDRLETKPGFYLVRHLRPERGFDERDGDATVSGAEAGEEADEEQQAEQFVLLSAGAREHVWLGALPPAPFVVELAEALGGGSRDNHVIPYGGAEPIAWAHPSTVVATAVGAALNGDVSLDRLGLPEPRLPEGRAGIAFYAVAGDRAANALDDLTVRTWPAGDAIPAKEERRPLEPSAHPVAGVVEAVRAPGPHWLSIERGDKAIVLALPVLPNRLATVVAQVEPTWMRLYQFHPAVEPERAPSSSPRRLRRLEHLERLLLGGGLDGARPLAEELAGEEVARDDPFAGLLAGYVLLRLGLYDPLGKLTSAIVEVAPMLSDAYILRGEREARAGRTEAANQAFADAVNAGIPAFGEGLTRLIEGLRVSTLHHPRSALVRHIFRGHARGIMWSAFTPSRKLESGRLVITGADVGYEG